MHTPSGARKQAAAEDIFGIQSFLGQVQRSGQIFIRGLGVAQLELEGLAGPGIGPHRQGAAFGIGRQQVADKKVAPPKILLVFINNEAQKDIEFGTFPEWRPGGR